MSADSEVTAMRALGVSFGQFAAPLLILSVLASAITGVLLAEAEPLARRTLRTVLSEIAARGGVIQPGSFNRLDRNEGRLIFVEEHDEQNRLTGVIILDRSDATQPFVVVAERGHFSFESETATAHLRLEDGDVHFESEEGSEDRYRRIGFADFDYAFDMHELLGSGPTRIQPKEMGTQRILEVLDHFEASGGWAPRDVRVKDKERYEIQLHRRLALPFAPFLFALVGIPLGLRRSHGARSWGVLICVGLVFVYYSLLSFGSFLAEDRSAPASVALWMPNVVFAVLAVPLLLRARRAEI
jgi:lipopolysaccharide export system permease protein